jgi:hypothetical protein
MSVVPSEKRKERVLSGLTVTSTTPQVPPEAEPSAAWRAVIWFERMTR